MTDHPVAETTAVKRSLLFGLLALQTDILEEWQFVDAWESLDSRPEKNVAQWLQLRGWMNDAERQEIERLVERKLVKHEGDLDAALKEILDNRPFEVFSTAIRESGKSGWNALGPLVQRIPFTTRVRAGLFRFLTTSHILMILLGLLGASAVVMLLVAQVRHENEMPYYGMAPAPARPTPALQANGNWQINDVPTLFVELVRQKDVIEHIKNDRSLDEPMRQQMLAEAQQFTQSANQFNDRSWALVSPEKGSVEVYKRGLLLAEEAVRLQPNQGYFVNTLGVAQYRLGMYKEALETLTRSDAMNTALGDRHPSDTYFLAMLRHRLGEKEMAKKLFEESKLLRQTRGDTQNSLYLAFEEEARQLLGLEKE